MVLKVLFLHVYRLGFWKRCYFYMFYFQQGSVGPTSTHHVPYTAKHLDVAKNMEEIHQTFKTVS